ncbi:MAG: DUF4397 domain-containing protein [Candidatus Eisenbacteria bacterium]|nr:DUF4397 domain-containing protein [Candidatus Eisenbacteria bacterium]
MGRFGLLWTLAILVALTGAAVAQTAQVQVIHNAADPAAAVVDIYVDEGADPFIPDFAFRTATPFVEVPAEVELVIGVAPGDSDGPDDIIASFPVTLEDGETYVVVANGVLDPSQFAPNPDGIEIGFSLYPRAGIRTSGEFGGVRVIGFHGATDAPTVDILVRGIGAWVPFNDLTYGEFSAYRLLRARPYVLDVTLGDDNDAVVASYEADLTGLGGGAAVVFASGFLAPTDVPTRQAFGLFAALPNGQVVEFPAVEQTAELQVIHNAADPAAEVVDIYVNGGDEPFIPDFAFRDATPFVEVPAGVELVIGVAPGDSDGPDDIIAEFPVTLENGETYVAVANGVLMPDDFAPNPDGESTAFTIFAVDGVRKSAGPRFVKLIGFHGATDAPTVDIRIHGPYHIWTLINDLIYGEFSSYRTLWPREYQLDVTPGNDNDTVVASFMADLSGLGGGAAVVFASGFLTPDDNQDGAGFGLFAALPTGDVVELPPVTPTARLQVIHNAADPAAGVVDIYVNEGDEPFIPDFAFRTATPYVDVPAGVPLSIGVAPGDSDGPDDIIATFEVTLDANERYCAMATGVLDPGAFEANPQGRPIAFTVVPRGGMREYVHLGLIKLIAFHGATDAPTVDIVARRGWWDWVLFDDIGYGEFSDYVTLWPTVLQLDVTPGGDNDTVVASYEADLRGLGSKGITVFASGFLTPDGDPGGEAFGLFATLPDGQVVELPAAGRGTRDVAGDPMKPMEFALGQNSPNPFNPVTEIAFALPEESDVTIDVYNVRGQRVKRLIDERRPAGWHTIRVDANDMASGVYFYRMQAGDFTESRKMSILK